MLHYIVAQDKVCVCLVLRFHLARRKSGLAFALQALRAIWNSAGTAGVEATWEMPGLWADPTNSLHFDTGRKLSAAFAPGQSLADYISQWCTVAHFEALETRLMALKLICLLNLFVDVWIFWSLHNVSGTHCLLD